MIKKLEEINGMNLQVGMPIEITINRSLDKREECNHKENGYFKELKKVTVNIIGGGSRYYHLIYTLNDNPQDQVCGIDDVMNIKILDYKN
jgi:hypothetical protein